MIIGALERLCDDWALPERLSDVDLAAAIRRDYAAYTAGIIESFPKLTASTK